LAKSTSPLILAIGWLIMTIVLLTLPGSAFPKENWLSKLWVDKWVHVVLFAILVILWCRAVWKTGNRISLKNYFVGITILGIAYGTGMEFIQRYLVANRSFDILDIVSDAAGCLIGLGFSLARYIKK